MSGPGPAEGARQVAGRTSAHWRETGAKQGDFPLQTAMIGLPGATSGYKEINYLPLTPALAKVGVGGSNPLARSNF